MRRELTYRAQLEWVLKTFKKRMAYILFTLKFLDEFKNPRVAQQILKNGQPLKNQIFVQKLCFKPKLYKVVPAIHPKAFKRMYMSAFSTRYFSGFSYASKVYGRDSSQHTISVVRHSRRTPPSSWPSSPSILKTSRSSNLFLEKKKLNQKLNLIN